MGGLTLDYNQELSMARYLIGVGEYDTVYMMIKDVYDNRVKDLRLTNSQRQEYWEYYLESEEKRTITKEDYKLKTALRYRLNLNMSKYNYYEDYLIGKGYKIYKKDVYDTHNIKLLNYRAEERLKKDVDTYGEYKTVTLKECNIIIKNAIEIIREYESLVGEDVIGVVNKNKVDKDLEDNARGLTEMYKELGVNVIEERVYFESLVVYSMVDKLELVFRQLKETVIDPNDLARREYIKFITEVKYIIRCITTILYV